MQHECRGEQRLHYHAKERTTNMKDKNTTTTVVIEGGSFGLTTVSEKIKPSHVRRRILLSVDRPTLLCCALKERIKNIVTLMWCCLETALRRLCFRGGNFWDLVRSHVCWDDFARDLLWRIGSRCHKCWVRFRVDNEQDLQLQHVGDWNDPVRGRQRWQQ